jgi:hypothetical protein
MIRNQAAACKQKELIFLFNTIHFMCYGMYYPEYREWCIPRVAIYGAVVKTVLMYIMHSLVRYIF